MGESNQNRTTPHLQHGITGSVHEMSQVWSYITVSYKNSVIYTASVLNNYRGILIYILTYLSKFLLYMFHVQRFIPYDIVMLFSKVLYVLKGMPNQSVQFFYFQFRYYGSSLLLNLSFFLKHFIEQYTSQQSLGYGVLCDQSIHGTRSYISLTYCKLQLLNE